MFIDHEAVLSDGDRATIDRKQSHHLIDVLRLKKGDVVKAVSAKEKKAWLAKIIEPNSKAVKIELLREIEVVNNRSLGAVICGLTKHGKSDLITEKATEIGAQWILFFESKRSVVRYKAMNLDKKVLRLSKIAMSAARQSFRLNVPEVRIFPSLQDCLDQCQDIIGCGDVRLFASLSDGTKPICSVLKMRFHKGSQVAHILTGPEGGLTDDEERFLINRGWQAVSLGFNILRAETAAIVSAGIVVNMGLME